MGKTQVCARSSQARGDPFRHPRDAIDDCVHWLAPFGDSALGGPLSLLCFRSWESAFYFWSARYATVGYGDVVLPWTWRTLGPVESIIGVLMCGLSASFLYAVVSRLVDREVRASDTAITVAGDTTPGTMVRRGGAARRGRSTVSIS